MKRKYLLSHDNAPHNYVLQIDNSSLEIMTTCARSAEYALIEGRVVEGRSALTFGTAHHEALEAHYKGLGIDVVRLKCLHSFNGVELHSGEWRTPDYALESVLDYLKKYKHETLKPLITPEGEPMVEIPFSIPLGEVEVNARFQFSPQKLVRNYKGSETDSLFVSKLTIFWAGKIDMLAAFDHMRWVLDHKTSSIKGESYFQDFELSHQTVGYTWAAEQILGERLDGFLLNLIINRKPTKTGTGREFVRRPYYYPRYRIEEWPQDTLALVADLIHYLRRGYFPPMRKWCVGKYGVCSYHDVCCAPATSRAHMLQSTMFKDNDWSPLD